jgi:ABC-type transporter Mla MlaB component
MSSSPLRRLPYMEPVVVRLSGPMTDAQVATLCAAVRQRLATRSPRVLVCRVAGPVDLGVVAVLARMQLVVGRLGGVLQVQATSAELPELLALTGLEGLVAVSSEPGRQAEAGEQGGVEEVVDVADLAR